MEEIIGKKRALHATYTKVKSKRKVRKLGVEEPVRKTLYDVVVENLKFSGRKTFLHRFIYIGRHSFKTEGDGIACFEKTVNTDGIEPISGLYLHYNQHFVHVVETDEGSIYKHLNLLFSSEDFDKLSDLTLLGDLCHINNRLISYWATYVGTPKSLVNPPKKSEVETAKDAAIQAFNCVNKINRLVDKMYGSSSVSLGKDVSSILEVQDDEDSSAKGETSASMSSQLVTKSSILGNLHSPFRDYLPERELLDYLIDSPYTQNLSRYLEFGGSITQVGEYSDKVWPVPEENIQYDVFEKDYDKMFTMTSQMGEQKEEEKSDDDDLASEDLDINNK
ncbi:unnamed protein product [Phyllotreta striolata]|uniref:Uncharacterized protein n=1 Tax=Phyllotreta striolata TaxID=444603 RepID=A0A9N9TSU0_PHYSR|nr:unnamed protein product [Phyllotreta striolata]